MQYLSIDVSHLLIHEIGPSQSTPELSWSATGAFTVIPDPTAVAILNILGKLLNLGPLIQLGTVYKMGLCRYHFDAFSNLGPEKRGGG